MRSLAASATLPQRLRFLRTGRRQLVPTRIVRAAEGVLVALKRFQEKEHVVDVDDPVRHAGVDVGNRRVRRGDGIFVLKRLECGIHFVKVRDTLRGG